MAKLDRAHSDEELSAVDEGRMSPKSALDKAKRRWGSAESLEGGRGLEDIHELNKLKAESDVLNQVSSTLDDLIKSNPELSKNSLLQKRLQEIRSITNPEEAKQVMQNIGSWRNDLNEVYGDLLQDGKNEIYFRKRANEWINTHRTLSLQEQVKWIKDVPTERAKRKVPFDSLEETLKNVEGLSSSQKGDLIKMFHEYMADHGRRENVKYADRVKENVGQFNKLMGKLPNLDKEEREQRAKDFLNVSEAEQKVELKKLRELTETQHLDEKFKLFKKERQKEHKDFFNLDKKEKEKVINSLTKEVTKEYRDSFSRHQDILAPGDLKSFEETIRRKDIALLEESIKDMPNVIKRAEEVDEKTNKLKKKFKDAIGEEAMHKAFRLVAWDSPFTTTLDRKRMIDARTLENMLKKEELEVREKNTKKYESKIDNKVGDGKLVAGHALMHKKGRDANKAWFKKLDTKKQNEINKKGCEVDRSIDKRKKLNQRFGKLPQAVQKEFHVAYANLGMEEREALTKRIEALRTKNEKVYEKQLKHAAEQDLIPSKSKKAQETLLEEFNNLSMREQVKRRENDKTLTGNHALKEAVLSFKKAFGQGNIPSNIYSNALQTLQTGKVHAHERIIYIKTFLAQYYQPGHTELDAKINELDEIKLKELDGKGFRDDMVDKEEEAGKEALENGNIREALEHYENASDMDEDREDLQILRDVLEDSEFKDAPLPPHVVEQSEEAFVELLKNPQIQKDMERFRILDETIYRIGISERAHQNIKEAEDRSMEGLKKAGASEEAIKLQEELSEFQEGKADDKKKVLMQENGDLQAQNIIELNFTNTDNDLMGNDPEKLDKRRELVKELRKKEGGTEGTNRVAFKDQNGETIKSEQMQRRRDRMFEVQSKMMSKILEGQMVKKGTPRALAEKAAEQIVSHKFEKVINEIDLKDLEG